MRDRVDEAQRSYTKLYPNLSTEQVEEDIAVQIFTVENEREHSAATNGASFLECFKGVNLRRTFVAAFPSAAQQLAGNQLVQSYSTCKFIVLASKLTLPRLLYPGENHKLAPCLVHRISSWSGRCHRCLLCH